MLPFTADEVVAAFQRHPAIKPKRGKFVQFKDDAHYDRTCGDVGACCALGILVVDAELDHVVRHLEQTGAQTGSHRIAAALKWHETSSAELVAFTEGFDSGADHTARFEGVRYPEAYRLGDEIARRVFDGMTLGETI